MRLKTLLIPALVILSLNIYAQSPFTAGAVLGGNFSQINNDNYAGYNKLGIHGGLKVITRISPLFDFHTELLFNQKGSYTSGTAFNSGKEQRISLSYIEIPLLFSVKDWYKENNNGASYYITHLLVGASYGRLINNSVEGFNNSQEGIPINEYFNSDDISLIGGVTFYINENLGIHGRFSYSLTHLNEKNSSEVINEIRGDLNTYLVTLRATYRIR